MLNEKPKLQSLEIKPFIIGGYEIRTCKYGAYCAWVKEEKDMKETNLEHYKEELKKIFNENCREPGNILFKIKKELNNDESIKTDRYLSSYTDDILDWMAQPYEKSILDEAERKYLSGIIRPFRNKVRYICKKGCGSNEYIEIDIQDDTDIAFPNFKSGSMYKGMEFKRNYSLKELGL